jgi:pimeloyl-ACP methyl ester carboxylesterase
MPSQPPVVFIHGLWIHSASWAPWIDYFATHGYASTAPGWPGDLETVEAMRADPSGLNDVGIEAICHHYADLIEAMDTPPIVIGHSFGGLIAQELLANGFGRAAVAIDPAPVKGVKHLPFAQLKSGFPVLGNPANRHRTVALSAVQFKYSFGNVLTDDESNALYEEWTIPGPGRPLFEDAGANFSRRSAAAVDFGHARPGPLLLTTGTLDHTVPQVVTEDVYRLYVKSPEAGQVDLRIFEGRGHSLTIDHGWKDVADAVLGWLDDHVPAEPAGSGAVGVA